MLMGASEKFIPGKLNKRKHNDYVVFWLASLDHFVNKNKFYSFSESAQLTFFIGGAKNYFTSEFKIWTCHKIEC